MRLPKSGNLFRRDSIEIKATRGKMNILESDNANDEAILEYDDGEFHVVKPGAFVLCAVSGVRIPLQALRYWSVDRQEAYRDAACAMKGMDVMGAAQ